MKIAVLVSGRGSNLQALIKNLHGFDVEIVGVVSDNEDAPALKHARTADIPTASFAEASYDGREARDLAIADWLDENQAELVVLAGYMALLSDSFVARFRDRIINVHPSLLPAFPGTRAVEMAVAAGVKVFGVTVHLVDEGIDTGPILLQRAVELDGYSDPTEIHQILQKIEHELLPERVRLMADGAVSRDPANPQRLIIER